ACLVRTFPLLDPYDMQRTTPQHGPMLDYEPAPADRGGGFIFTYLSSAYGPALGLLEALEPVADRLWLVAPMLPEPARQALAARGARVLSPQSLPDLLPRCCLVVHGGGHGVACEALAAGIPQ